MADTRLEILTRCLLIRELGIGHVEAVPLGEGQWETGYHIIKGHAGNGYAAEAVAAFLPDILRHLGIDTVYGVCDAENTASCRVLKKCGFSLMSEGRAAYHGRQANDRRYIFSRSHGREDEGSCPFRMNPL